MVSYKRPETVFRNIWKKGIKSNNKSFFKRLRSRKPARAYGKDIKGMLRKKRKEGHSRKTKLIFYICIQSLGRLPCCSAYPQRINWRICLKQKSQ